MARILAPYRTFEASVDGVASPTALGAVHACSCWTPATCRWLVAAADAFGGWGTERHASVPTTDLEVLKVDALRDWLLCESRETLFPTLAHLYGFEPSELHFMDLFLVRYTAEQGEGGQRGLRSHRDRSLLSFNLLLSDPGAFDGGGTRIHALDGQTVHPRAQGDLVAHSGKLLHTGMPVTRGTREILVGFVGVNSPNVDQPFLRSLFAKLNIEGTARDFEILRRAMRTQPKGDKHASEPAADTRVADTGVADTGAVDSGVADAGFADTGAADTGAADTGAADIGAADTGAADTGDRYSCDSFNSNETAEESVTVSGGNRNGTLSYADGGDGTGDGSGDGTGGYAEGGKIAVEAGTDDANVTAAPAETAGGEPDGSYIGDEPGGGYSSGGPLLVLRGARAARDARMRKGVGYISLRRYVMHLAAEAHAARIARSAVFDNFERERQAAAVAVEEVAARERAFVHRTAAASRGYLVTAPAPKGGIHIGANTAAAVVAVGPEAARELAAKIQETAEEEVMMRVAETELREAHVERVALREVMHARELAPYFIGRVARGQMGRQQAKIKKIEALGVVATKIQAAQRRHAAQSKYKTTKAGREYDMLQAELAWYETFRAQAAARIQKVARGKQTRRREVFLRASKQEDLTASRAAAVVRRREKAHSAVEAATAEAAATAMQAVVRGKAAREERADLLLVRQAQQRAAELALLERAAAEAALAAAAAAAIAAELLQAAEAQYIAADRRAAAVSIQSAARGCNLRNSILANSKNRYAAVAIQAIARGRRGRRKLGEEMAEVERKERVVLEVRDAAKARMRKMQKRAEAVADALAAIVFGHVREVTRELVAELLAEDTGAADTGVVGTGAADTGATDTGVADTGAVDTGAVDTGAADTGVGQSSDTGAELLEGHAVAAADSQGQAGEALTADSQGADSQAGQVRSIDSEEEAADTGAPDTGVADTELMDTGAPDTGVADTELMDNGAADVGPADTEAAVTEPAARGSPLEAAIVVVDESAEDDHRTSLAQESSKAQSRRQSVPDTPALRAALSTDAGGPATRAATTPAVAPSPAAAPPAPPTPPAAPAKPDALDDLFGDDFGEADGGEGASGDLDDLLAGDGFD